MKMYHDIPVNHHVISTFSYAVKFMENLWHFSQELPIVYIDCVRSGFESSALPIKLIGRGTTVCRTSVLDDAASRTVTVLCTRQMTRKGGAFLCEKQRDCKESYITR